MVASNARARLLFPAARGHFPDAVAFFPDIRAVEKRCVAFRGSRLREFGLSRGSDGWRRRNCNKSGFHPIETAPPFQDDAAAIDARASFQALPDEAHRQLFRAAGKNRLPWRRSRKTSRPPASLASPLRRQTVARPATQPRDEAESRPLSHFGAPPSAPRMQRKRLRERGACPCGKLHCPSVLPLFSLRWGDFCSPQCSQARAPAAQPVFCSRQASSLSPSRRSCPNEWRWPVDFFYGARRPS